MQTNDTLEALIAPVVEGMGYELWGVVFIPQRHSAQLRVYLDKPGGATLDDCARVSHQVSGVLDVENPIKTSYRLEVSTPGMERPLFKKTHFERFLGHKARIRCKWLIEGRRKLVGAIADVTETDIQVEEDGKRFTVPFAAIDQAHLVS